jgi:chromosome segregation ATPase
MQDNITTTLTEKMKLEYLDETIKKLNNNFESMAKVSIESNTDKNNAQIKAMEQRITELTTQIMREQDEKVSIKNEFIMLKNKVEYESKRETVSKDELNSLKHRQEVMAKKLEENKRHMEENNNEGGSNKNIIQQLTKENQELKLKIEDGSSDQLRLRADLNKIEENYQNHILKIHDRMQNIESTSQPELRTNCDVLESDD